MRMLAVTLAGPALMAVAALAMGRLFFRLLRVPLERGEAWALEWIAGAPLVAVLVALAGAAHQARKSVFIMLTTAALAGVLCCARRRSFKRLPPVPRPWMALFAVVFTGFAALYLAHAVAPELAGGERLGTAFREWQERRLAAPPEPMRMLFLFAFSVGRHAAAAVVHCAFLLLLPWAVLAYARRRGLPAVGVFAGLAVFVSPATAVAGTAALDDVALAALLFAAFYLAEVYRDGGGRGALAAAIVLAGFALWTRPPALPAFAWRSPRELALLGTAAGSFLGPVFLLAPFSLLALRYREGRRLVLAAVLVGAPGLAGGEARWLVPALPFLALAMGMAFARARGALPALAAVQCLFCWPDVTPLYHDLGAWRIGGVRETVAMLRTAPDVYLNARLPGYVLARLLDEVVPRGARVFAFGPVARAYTAHEVVAGGVVREALLTAVRPALQPSRRVLFAFEAKSVRALRVRGVASVSEVRVLDGNGEVRRNPGWRLRAEPEVEAAALAFDNNYATRWSAASAPGAFLEVDFGEPLRVSAVTLECPLAPPSAAVLEARLENGAWTVPAKGPEVRDGPPPAHLREAAMEEVRARGIRYLLVRNEDEGASDFRANGRLWGIVPIMDLYGARIYSVD